MQKLRFTTKATYDESTDTINARIECASIRIAYEITIDYGTRTFSIQDVMFDDELNNTLFEPTFEPELLLAFAEKFDDMHQEHNPNESPSATCALDLTFEV